MGRLHHAVWLSVINCNKNTHGCNFTYYYVFSASYEKKTKDMAERESGKGRGVQCYPLNVLYAGNIVIS